MTNKLIAFAGGAGIGLLVGIPLIVLPFVSSTATLVYASLVGIVFTVVVVLGVRPTHQRWKAWRTAFDERNRLYDTYCVTIDQMFAVLFQGPKIVAAKDAARSLAHCQEGQAIVKGFEYTADPKVIPDLEADCARLQAWLDEPKPWSKYVVEH